MESKWRENEEESPKSTNFYHPSKQESKEIVAKAERFEWKPREVATEIPYANEMKLPKNRRED